MAAPIFTLPNEILVEIARNLPKKTQAVLLRVHPVLNRVCNHELYRLDDTGTPDLKNAMARANHVHGEALLVKILTRSWLTLMSEGYEARQHDALVIACRQGFVDVVRQLLEARVHPDVRGEEGDRKGQITAFTVAWEAGNRRSMDRLILHCAKLEIYNFITVARLIQDRKDLAQWLINRGLDIRQRDADGNTLLHFACDRENASWEVVRILLDNGLDPNATNSAGQTPIYAAICRARKNALYGIPIILLLLTRGVDVNAPCHQGWSPLHVACEYSCLAIVHLLLNSGADPNRQHPVSNGTAIFCLAQRNPESLDILELLVHAGCDLTTHSGSIEELLLAALRKGWLKTGQYLCDNFVERLTGLGFDDLLFIGAASLGQMDLLRSMVLSGTFDVNSNDHATTALIEAAKALQVEVVEFLINEAGFTDLDTTDWTGTSALFASIHGGPKSEAIVRFLLPLVDFNNASDNQGNVPMEEAIYCLPVELIKLMTNRMIERVALRVDVREELSWAMLVAIQQDELEMVKFFAFKFDQLAMTVPDDYAVTFEAVICGYTEVANFLIDEGIALNNKDQGHTPLTKAIVDGKTDLATKLIAKGADVELMSVDGHPLYLAAFGGQIEIVKLLLAAEADINAKWKEKTALEGAITEGYVDIVRLLLEAGAQGDGELLLCASMLENAEILSILVNHGLSINYSLPHERLFPLFVASVNRRIHNVVFLLRAGANPNQVDRRRQHPLFATAVCGDVAIARMLLEAGGDANKVAHTGKSPLFLAVYNQRVEIAELYINHGAHVNIFARPGRTPLTLAISKGDVDMVWLLLANGADASVTLSAPRIGYNNDSCLHIAARVGSPEIIRLLLDAGCDVLAKDAAGKTPLEVAKDGDEALIAALYSAHPAA